MGVFKAVRPSIRQKMYQAGQWLQDSGIQAKPRGQNIVKCAIEGGFSFGDVFWGFHEPHRFRRLGPEWQANLNRRKPYGAR
jgi:hypothetical protein